MDAGARGRGRGRGRARGGRAAGRGGRAAGRGGRGAGRGLPEAEASAESAVPSVGTASVTQSVPLAGGANFGAGGGAGVGGDAGAGAAPGGGGAALAQGDMIVGLLTQLLARFPQAVPQQAPGAPPAAGAHVGAGLGDQPGAAFVGQQQAAGLAEQQGAAGFVGQHGAAFVGHPPYLEMMREMQRIGTPFFEGKGGPEEADEWRQRLERNFGSVRCPEEYRVELAVHYLGGDAHLWWRFVATRRAVWTWGEFLAEFNAKYFPREARDRFHQRFLALAQGERSVREYDLEFSRLVVHVGFGFGGERDVLQRFLQGLRSNIRRQCRGRDFTTRAELVELAATIEEDLREEAGTVAVPAAVVPATQPRGQQQRQHRRGFSSGYGRGGRPAHGQKRRADEISASSPSTGGCFGCGSLDHRVATCPKRATSRETTVCFYCKEPGHIRTYCPKLQQKSVAAIQPLAIQPVSQIAALQPVGQTGGAPRVYSTAEAGQTSQSGQITGKISDSDL